jgi:hypothetical protein
MPPPHFREKGLGKIRSGFGRCPHRSFLTRGEGVFFYIEFVSLWCHISVPEPLAYGNRWRRRAAASLPRPRTGLPCARASVLPGTVRRVTHRCSPAESLLPGATCLRQPMAPLCRSVITPCHCWRAPCQVSVKTKLLAFLVIPLP